MKTLGLMGLAVAAVPLIALAQGDEAATTGKTFVFHQTSAGDCIMQNGTLAFDSLGNGAVSLATTTTKDDDNIWKSRVQLKNVNGQSVFTSPVLNSPKMENKDGHPQTYRWSFSFHVDPTLLTSITSAEMVGISCS